MNSQSLQKEFPSVYEDFFAKNDLILSANHSFAWNLGFGENKDKVHIRKKIPTKTFCGINSLNERKIEFGGVYFFDILQQKFNRIQFGEINKQEQKIKELLLSFLEKNGFEKGMSIQLLSETPRGHGLAFSGTSGILIASAVFSLLKKINKETLSNYDEFTQSDEFEQIFSLGLEIEKISKYGDSIGNNCYSALMNTELPTITFLENDGKGEKTHKYKIKDFLNIQSEMDEINLDYGIIFSGISNKVEHLKHLSFDHEQELTSLEDKTLAVLKSKGIKDTKKFPFKNIFINGFNQTFKDMTFIYNFKTLLGFKDMLEQGFKEEVVHEFIQSRKENSFISGMVEENNKITGLFEFYFNTFKKLNDEVFSIYPINFLQTGGSLVFISKFKKSRQTILSTLEKLKKIGYKDISLEYASWIDGTSKDGLTMEQYISEGVFSSYVQKNQIYYKDNKGESRIDSYEQILQSEKKGLLLDTINGKIFLNGRKLTSKDLRSQVTTINILGTCMQHIGEDIHNKELEISGYSKNKNEMIGKIVIPLIELIYKETGEKLPLICKGSIHDFFVKLNSPNIKISTIKKV